MKRALIIINLCIVSIALGWVYTYDVTTPAGTDSPSIIDDRIRESKAALQERLDVDHYFEKTTNQVSDANAGTHRKITFHSSITPPSPDDGQGMLYLYDYNSIPELWWVDVNDNRRRFTQEGKLYVSSDTVFDSNVIDSSVIAAGGVDTNNIADDAVTTVKIADANVTTSLIADGAVTTDKIADANVTAAKIAGLSPTDYAGENSVTLANGMVMKFGEMGYVGRTEGTIDFASRTGSAFSTACVFATIQPYRSNAQSYATVISSISKTQIKFYNDTPMTKIYWMAIGY